MRSISPSASVGGPENDDGVAHSRRLATAPRPSNKTFGRTVRNMACASFPARSRVFLAGVDGVELLVLDVDRQGAFVFLAAMVPSAGNATLELAQRIVPDAFVRNSLHLHRPVQVARRVATEEQLQVRVIRLAWWRIDRFLAGDGISAHERLGRVLRDSRNREEG